jgi:hypothetical protein
MTDQIKLRRRLHQQQHITEMSPLTFQSDSAEIDVGTVHVFDDYDGSIAIALVTGTGTTTLRLPPDLASDLAAGVTKLIRQRSQPAPT